MLSKAQKLEILEKMYQILKRMNDSTSISEISTKTKIPKSTIQRYLNKEEYYEFLVEEHILDYEKANKLMTSAREWLESSKKNGLKKGGKNTQLIHGYTKKKDGKFSGIER